jgi:hypothetical protein
LRDCWDAIKEEGDDAAFSSTSKLSEWLQVI